ncbi:MAG TPA: glycosyltransferase [Bacteroidales bacterium]|nr:glycosyltransferase [Bacteroidales bacterium]
MKLLVILSRVPYPLEKGDKLRAFYFLKFLAKNNELILFCLDDNKNIHPDAINELRKICKSINIFHISKFSILKGIIYSFFKGLPLQVGYFYNKHAKKLLFQLIEQEKPEHIFCQLIRVAEYVKDINIPKTLDYQDAFSKGVKRRLNVSPFYLKPILKIEYKRLFNYENKVFDAFDNKIIISEADKELIPHHFKNDIIVIPNGIDTDYFNPDIINYDNDKQYDILFTGNMSYSPNELSAQFLAKKILPAVHKSGLNVNLLIAGANPSAKVKSLKTDKVFISGWVDDIREVYNKSRIFVAPMQIGTGLQNKLLEAMAMGLPCITSSLANKALGAKEGEEIIVCDTIKDYVEAILKLLKDDNLAYKIASAGRAYVKRKYKWIDAVDLIEKIIYNTTTK